MAEKYRYKGIRITKDKYPTNVNVIGRGHEYIDIYNDRGKYPKIVERYDATMWNTDTIRDNVRKKHGREIDFI